MFINTFSNFVNPPLLVYPWKGFLILLRTDRRYFKTYGVVSSKIWRTMICCAWWTGLKNYSCTLCTTQFLLLSGLYDNASSMDSWCGAFMEEAPGPPCFLFCFVFLGQLYGVSVYRMENLIWRYMAVHFCTSLHTSLLLYVLVRLFL